MTDADWMDRALAIARPALGSVWPNPAVGCVLVRDGRAVAEGVTRPGGRPHAEAMALQAAGAAAAGATAYVTLEPCAHHGQTPPCARALAEAGVARVVVATGDPDPRVAGRGIAMLRAAGVAVETGVRTEAAEELNAGFLMRIRRGRPRIALKLAATLDGRIATAAGESRWITGPEARAEVHAMRAAADAILIGAGTARADDPALDVRDAPAPPRPPVRVVADPGLSLPLTGRLARTAGDRPLWLLHAEGGVDPARADVLRGLGAQLLPVPPGADGRLDLAAAAQALGARGLTRVLCEGGGRIAAGLVAAGLADEVTLFTAGAVIGGDGVPVMGALGLDRLADAPRFRAVEHRLIGADLMSRWRPAG